MTGHTPFTSDVTTALELSLREALARRDGSIGLEHLLLGVLLGADSRSRVLIEASLPAGELRRRIVAYLDRAAWSWFPGRL